MTTRRIVLEDDSGFLLLENGDYILLEGAAGGVTLDARAAQAITLDAKAETGDDGT